MNFNASRNLGQTGGIRKPKRVSDVATMGSPSPPPQPPVYSPAPTFDSAYGSNINQPQDGMAYDPNFYGASNMAPTSAPNFNYANQTGDFVPQNPVGSPFPQTPAQFSAVFQQPIVQDMALQYGQQIANQGKAIVHRELEKYVPVSRLKYYFAVDTRYVMKKLCLIFFPFTHKDWTVKYEQEHPVQPRYEINAPDLYIPTMAYVTYIVLAGFVLGMQHKFSPEQIGIQASSALAYSLFEIVMYLATLYITNINSNLKTLDLLAFSGYKYTVMIASVVASIFFKKTGYYIALVYCSLALVFFLVRTLKVQVLSGSPPKETYGYGQNENPYGQQPSQNISGSKRRVYFLLFVALTQPVLSWWLSYHLVPASVGEPSAEAKL